MAHRLIRLMYKGVDPKLNEVDHKDGDGLNNRIGNLRSVTPAVNRRNLIRKRRTQQAGVYWVQRLHKFEVSGRVNGKQKHIGVFNSEQEAITARLTFDKKIAKQTHDVVGLKKAVKGLRR